MWWVWLLTVIVGGIGAFHAFVTPERLERFRDWLLETVAWLQEDEPPTSDTADDSSDWVALALGPTDNPIRKEYLTYDFARRDMYKSKIAQMTPQEAEKHPRIAKTFETAWQRTLLSPEEQKTLKALLVRKAMFLVPMAQQMSEHVNSKGRLYQEGFLNESQWEEIQNAKSQIEGDMVFIRSEAECLQAGWNAHILSQAVSLHERKKQQQAAEAAAQKDVKPKLQPGDKTLLDQLNALTIQ